jgi:hypothetical protein
MPAVQLHFERATAFTAADVARDVVGCRWFQAAAKLACWWRRFEHVDISFDQSGDSRVLRPCEPSPLSDPAHCRVAVSAGL